jgi:hypothetical protein
MPGGGEAVIAKVKVVVADAAIRVFDDSWEMDVHESAAIDPELHEPTSGL